MPQLVNVPGIGQLQFPDGMSQQDMAAAIQHNFPQIHGQQQQSGALGAVNAFVDKLGSAVAVPGKPQWNANALATAVTSRLPGWLGGESADTLAAREAAAEQQHPIAGALGSLAGIAPAAYAGGALAGGLADAAGVASPLARAALIGAGQGAASAPASPLTGAATGAVLNPAVDAAGGLVARMANAQPDQTIGLATGNALFQLIERGLSHIPGGASIGQAIRNTNDAIGNRVATIVDNLRGASSAEPQDAGQMLSDSLNKASARIKAASGAQFDAILDKIPSGAKIPVTNVYSTLENLTAIPAGAEHTGQQFIDPKLVQIRTALANDMQSGNGMLPIDAVRRLKTMLGGMIQWDGRGDAANGVLKKVYGALTQDITEGAQTIDPKLAPMIDKANSDYQVATAQMDVLQKVINKAGGPDAIFNSLMSQSKTGSLQLRNVLGQLSPTDRQLLAATQLKRLGLANPGVQGAAGDAFSADTFLTNWNKMNPDAKTALFGELPGDYSRNISQLAQNIEALKRYGKTLSNTSGTAHVWWYGATATELLRSIITGSYKEMGAVAGTVGVTKLLATALTNPKTVAWLAKRTLPALVPGAAATAGAIAPRGQRP